MKSKEGKEKWRPFMNQFEGTIEDWNMGSLVRLDADEEMDEKNTTFAPRVQFLAIEIARNREGYNDNLRAKFGKKQAEDHKLEKGQGDHATETTSTQQQHKSSNTTHQLSVNKEYFDKIMVGQKSVEGRAGKVDDTKGINEDYKNNLTMYKA